MISKLGCALLAVIAAVSSEVEAAPIRFMHRGVGSGTLNDVPFASSPFVITAIGDTSARLPGPSGSPVWFINHSSAEIEIAGLGSYSTTMGTRTFVHRNNRIVGFAYASTFGFDLFDGPTDASFSSWNMLTSIGPVSGIGKLLQWGQFGLTTTGGLLKFADQASTPATFKAVLIPEPSTFAIAASSLVAASLIRRQRTCPLPAPA